MNTLDWNAVSWLEDMCQKLEAMCVEKLYSDAMEDLLPPLSDDPMKPGNHGLNSVHNFYMGVCDKSEIDIRRNHLKSINEEKDIEHVKVATQIIGLQSSSQELTTHCNGESEEKLHHLETPVLNETPVEGKCDDYASPIISSPGPIISDESGSDEDMLNKSDGMSYESAGDEIESNADDDKEALGKMKLDESCVLVNKSEQFSTAHVQGKRRSYKKKIRDVFNLRRWSSGKNQEQLKAWHQESNSLESDWEIL